MPTCKPLLEADDQWRACSRSLAMPSAKTLARGNFCLRVAPDQPCPQGSHLPFWPGDAFQQAIQSQSSHGLKPATKQKELPLTTQELLRSLMACHLETV
ncbi:MAG: hypothetical protein FRX49_10059 [Trebouxia sp. A1-2]|nr:MAG: hypothetical protein FRX49_10059 [Trebouxia sp. A1-2]